MSTAAKGKIFVSFIAKTTKMLVGVREKLPSNNRIELNLNTEKVALGTEEYNCTSFKGGLKIGEEFVVSIGINIDEGFVSFVIGGTRLDNYYFTERWS